MPNWTKHVLDRWVERFPSQCPFDAWLNARKATKQELEIMKVTEVKTHNVYISDCTVFIVKNNTVITTWPLPYRLIKINSDIAKRNRKIRLDFAEKNKKNTRKHRKRRF